ncbi:MAG: tetratricopeptide repeat protein [Planctomycetes bacterium]|nr:tetratricopeptide repeat protein [Planctomycetota bacterium]MCB9912928.1 tetratricopeptide repeat protein [Planctomycetota bacterium]HRV79822.1 tetratricopeptide repeat protein [Planctomycetota bacterium]
MHRPSRLPLAPWLGCVLLAIPLVVGCHQEVPTVAPPDIATLGRLQPSIRTDLEQATQALKADLRNPGLWGQLGTRYESNGLPEVALVCFEQAAALDSKSPRWPYRAAVVAARAGNLEAAIEWGRASLRLDPSYYTTYERLGTWELQLGNLEQASSYFEQACTLDPQRAGGWAGQARVALQTDEVAQALQSIRKARELDSQDPYWKLLEGITLARLGRDEEAKPLLAEGQGSKPTLIDPWTQSSKSIRSQESDLFQRGMQLEDQNQFDEAIAIYREILADRPGEARLPLRLAKTLLKAQRPAEAMEVTKKALERFPTHLELEVLRGHLLEQSGDPEGAWASSQKAIQEHPERPDGYLFQSTLLAKQGLSEQAISVAQGALRLSPSDERSRSLLASLYLRQQRYAEAIQVIEEALELPDAVTPLGYYQILAQAYKATGQTAKLSALMQKVGVTSTPAEPK